MQIPTQLGRQQLQRRGAVTIGSGADHTGGLVQHQITLTGQAEQRATATHRLTRLKLQIRFRPEVVINTDLATGEQYPDLAAR